MGSLILRIAATLALSACLVGCFGNVQPKPAPAIYDLPLTAGLAAGAQLPALKLADVQSPPWLNTPAMQYRLAYAEPARRYSYVESRWAAAPADLLAQALKRSDVVRSDRLEGGGCQLHIELNEFVQVFDAAERSRVEMDAQVSLLAPGAPRVIVQRSFRLSATAGADGRSGVGAFGGLASQFLMSLADWLALQRAQSPEVVTRCGGIPAS